MKTKNEIIEKISNCKGKCCCYDQCISSVSNASESENGLKLADYATRCADKNAESK